jgi:hypothetical protein
MVGDTGRTPDTRRIRRLKTPQALEVEATAEGTPARLKLADGWQVVSLTRRPWRIDQHWWRGDGVSRVYYRVAPEDGPPLTIYQDLVSGKWFAQEYA